MAGIESDARPQLSEAGVRLLWALAGHKYGWTYVSTPARHQTALALERAGLVTVTGDVVQATDAGRYEASRRWPRCPFVLGTYVRPPEGWSSIGEGLEAAHAA